MNHDHSQHADQPKPFWRSRYSIGLIVFSSIALYFLLTEHRAHFFGVLPILLLFSCLFMHMFMHHGHSSHGGHKQSKEDLNSSDESPTSKKEEQP